MCKIHNLAVIFYVTTLLISRKCFGMLRALYWLCFIKSFFTLFRLSHYTETINCSSLPPLLLLLSEVVPVALPWMESSLSLFSLLLWDCDGSLVVLPPIQDFWAVWVILLTSVAVVKVIQNSLLYWSTNFCLHVQSPFLFFLPPPRVCHCWKHLPASKAETCDSSLKFLFSHCGVVLETCLSFCACSIGFPPERSESCTDCHRIHLYYSPDAKLNQSLQHSFLLKSLSFYIAALESSSCTMC